MTIFPIVMLFLAALVTPLPSELADRSRYEESVRVFDREGGLLREVRAGDATRAHWMSLESAGVYPPQAILAAEDRRFFHHPGVDPIAIVRAAAMDVGSARIVSGASTLTMQLARLVRPHRRTFWGKFREMALAFRIEASLSKRAIAEEYLNRAPFGPGLRGLDAASRYYFDKPPTHLSLAEAATLAAIPRGPSLYNLRKYPERVLRRRDRILGRMHDAQWIEDDGYERALSETLTPHFTGGSFGAPHFVRALMNGAIASPVVDQKSVSDVVTTLDRNLQGEIENAVRAMLKPVASRHVTAASIVVIDNATGDVLAYVGSPDFFDDGIGGQNDGVLAKRQPGSTLKPFVYGLAMDRLGFTPATLLPDVQMHFEGATTSYVPMNYDNRFHGPVRLRDALANSLNIPAVWTTERLGVHSLLEFLRTLGFDTFTEGADVYGMALALGDGEVRLLDLARAYATLARGGTDRPLNVVRSLRAGGKMIDTATDRSGGRRLLPVVATAMITDILRDKKARIGSFGDASALELPFDVAVKTGTSKHYRDNWCVGYTRERTVAVWAGNFDGSPMDQVSGVTGAAPLFRIAMEAAMRGIGGAPLMGASEDAGGALTRISICPLSGGAAKGACPYSALEWVPESKLPLEPCTMHERVLVDRTNGLRAGPSCGGHDVELRSYERYDPQYLAWAHEARRHLAPTEMSPRCPVPRRGGPPVGIQIGEPRDGSRYILDPSRPLDHQQLSIRAETSPGAGDLKILVDGHVLATTPPPYVAFWAMTPGAHVIEALSVAGGRSRPTRIFVTALDDP